MSRRTRLATIAAFGAATIGSTATASIITFSHPDGLAAEAEFELLDATTLQMRLRNTSTGVPFGFSNSDQLLTGISWDFGAPGVNPGDPTITGGSIVIGPESMSLNFDTGEYGPGTDVGGEWGYGNDGGTGHLPNLISTLIAHAVPLGGPNLDGPVSLDGPQGGIIADPGLVDLGGLGAIQNEVIAILTLSQAVDDLSFLAIVRVEYGSDAAFITVPAPAALPLLGFAGLVGIRRRRAG